MLSHVESCWVMLSHVESCQGLLRTGSSASYRSLTCLQFCRKESGPAIWPLQLGVSSRPAPNYKEITYQDQTSYSWSSRWLSLSWSLWIIKTNRCFRLSSNIWSWLPVLLVPQYRQLATNIRRGPRTSNHINLSIALWTIKLTHHILNDHEWGRRLILSWSSWTIKIILIILIIMNQLTCPEWSLDISLGTTLDPDSSAAVCCDLLPIIIIIIIIGHNQLIYCIHHYCDLL